MLKCKFLPLFSSLCLLLVFSLAGCSAEPEAPLVPKYKTGLDKKEIRNSAFSKQFPAQWQTYQRNTQANEAEARATETKYKASFPFRKNDNTSPVMVGKPGAGQPYLKNLWLGYPFSFEYNEARGHTYAVEDILNIDRINRYDEAAGLPSTCWNCKTAKIPSWVEENGDKFWSMNFNLFRSKEKIDVHDNTIGCANCHNSETMELSLYSVPLKDYLARKNIDYNKLSRNEKRSLACAQCHVEYYFQEPDHGAARKPVFPWDNGMEPEDMYTYYNDKGKKKEGGGFAQFADWVHPVSKTPMIKVQHPEYEFWYNGTHGAAGVSCADCHMPYTRLDGKKKVSSHLWTSPLRNDDMIKNSCGQCHTDKDVKFLRERVQFTQDRVYKQLITAQDISVLAHESVRRASEWQGMKGSDFDATLAQAREMVRKGQFYWDLVSAENSVGFHNPSKALDTLSMSQQYSRKAVELASAATNYEIAKDLAGDVRQLVPPLLEWSRKLMMDQANLDMHVWTRYLKPLPKTEQVWDGQERKVPMKQSGAEKPGIGPVSVLESK
ncbi:MAG: ammonia-forming cytochrome c nitrite reductase subunit c552 [Desulfovibrio sp.]|jgi:nitrite reductase (cytochrome c-552)|nr:ammonia-forming cytochrome c nitrite reductase subunit c552 [Desulfovibrio sp.]